MKALFLSLPLRGHVNPSLPLVRELVERGDEIVYYSADPFAQDIERAGGRYRPYPHGSLADLDDLSTRTEALPWLLMRASAHVLAEGLEGFRAEQPDFVIADSVAPWGQWTAEILRVPVVTSISTFAFNRHVLAFGAGRGMRPWSLRRLVAKMRYMSRAFLIGRRLSRMYGVRGPGVIGSVIGRSDLNIVYTSRYFQPCADTFDERFQFVGPLLAPRAETATFPWDRVRLPVVVYVSLGTLFNADVTFYRNCFEAFAGEDCQVIMATGTRVSRDDLGAAPPNFIVEPHVPQLDVLRRVSAFVTHGGMNSVSESLCHSVPVVVVPYMGEQAIVGRRVEALGAGLYLDKENATPEALRASVRQLLADAQFRRQADAVRSSFQAAGGAARGASAIFTFTGRQP